MPELAIFTLALAWDETPSWASVEGAASRAEVARWLRHDDHEQAVRELVKLGPTVVPLLLGARNRRGHRRALEALGRLGPAAEPAADAVIADLSHRSGNVRLAAATALGRIGGPTAVAALERTLLGQNNARWWLRAAAARALAPSHGATARQALTRAARMDRDRRTRLIVIESLLHSGPDEVDEPMRHEVHDATRSEQPQVREIAERVWGLISHERPPKAARSGT